MGQQAPISAGSDSRRGVTALQQLSLHTLRRRSIDQSSAILHPHSAYLPLTDDIGVVREVYSCLPKAEIGIHREMPPARYAPLGVQKGLHIGQV